VCVCVCVCVCARVLFARVVIIFEVPEVFIVCGLNVVSNLLYFTRVGLTNHPNHEIN
jgi:hypothetical protein